MFKPAPITPFFENAESIADVILALGRGIHDARPVGSRITCTPAPIDTDEDWLVLLAPNKDETDLDAIRALGFTQDGRPEFYTGSEAGGFRSFRRDEVNIVTTRDPMFFDLFMTATGLAKRFNLLDKGDRIALFQAVLYGVRTPMLEDPHGTAVTEIPVESLELN